MAANVIEVLLKLKDQLSAEMSTAMNKVNKSLKDNAVGMAEVAAAGAVAVLALRRISMEAAGAENAQVMLADAMKRHGQFTQEALDKNLAFASSLSQVVLATDNVGHLSRYVGAERWQDIA